MGSVAVTSRRLHAEKPEPKLVAGLVEPAEIQITKHFITHFKILTFSKKIIVNKLT